MIVNGTEYRPYNHIYAVSKSGKVLRHLEPYTPWVTASGYKGCGRGHLLHRMVASVWIRPPNKGEEVHHINHNKADNRAANLEWVDKSTHRKSRHKDSLLAWAKTPPSKEAKEKLRKLRTGKRHSEESKAKISSSLKAINHKPAPRTGARSKEEINRRLDNPTRATGCVVDGVSFVSFAAASRATGVHRFTIRKRCLSKNFPNYTLG